MTELIEGRNDKFKTQNCRMFHKEKYCPFGSRCHFRHEYRSFVKVHKVFYMAHTSALRLTAEEILTEAKTLPTVNALFTNSA